MKAFVRTSKVDLEVKLEEVPLPEIHPDEVMIKVEAFGVGIHDRYYIPEDVNFPYVIGSEGTGTITELGIKATNFKVGDRVIFTTVFQPQGGCWAEYTTVKEGALMPLPDNLSFTQGATLPIAGKTALECMRALNLKKGDHLFIAGASGAIGTLVIQLAAKEGILISASASAKNQEYMNSLGAEMTVDYNDPDWITKIKEWSNGGVTAALAIQPGTGKESIKTVKPGRKLITVSGDHDQIQAERGIIPEQMEHSYKTQQKLLDLIETIAQGEIQIVIDKEYPFEQALDALKKTETRHARGKSVVKGLN